MLTKLNEEDYLELLKLAKKASKNSYSPYSKIKVGAAILTIDRNIFSGTNVENKSYGLTMCAERVAIYNALANNYKSFAAIAVYSPHVFNISPCGACRQVINEFNSHCLIIMDSNENKLNKKKLKPKVFEIDYLLPNSF